MISKISRFIRALFWHIWAGFPKSTQEQIEYRMNICEQCEMFDSKNSQCLICGCNLGRKKIFMNKLAWADQECPIQKWKKIKSI
jgi:uncharacterized paraquat-inducible protein A